MIAVLVSGGKDSTSVLLLALKKLGKERVIAVFNDTGFEHSLTYRYLDYLEERLGIKIVRLKSDRWEDLPTLILEKKRFPSALHRFCTYHLKQVPLAKFLAQHPVEEVWVGIRAEESRRRKERYGGITGDDTIPYVELAGGLPAELRKTLKHVQARFPIVDWTEEEVFRFLEENGIEPNPLYRLGHRRVGCFPCILGSFHDFKLCWNDEEGRRNILRLVEIEDTLRSRGYMTRLKDHMTARELVRRLQLNDAQLDMFCGEACALCSL